MNAISRAAAAAALCTSVAACATTSPPASSLSATKHVSMGPAREMALGAPVDPPSGFVSLCLRSPVDCVQTDTPQARAGAVLQAQSIARASWQRVIERAAAKGLIEAPAPAPASIGAPTAATGQAATAAAAAPDAGASPAPSAPLAAPAAPSDALSDAGPSAAPSAADPTPTVASAAATPAPDARTNKVALDAATWSQLARINAHVNHAIRPASDVAVYGVSDWWATPLSSGLAPFGDCKAYVLEKRRELIAAGVPGAALSIAVVRTPWRELHAVLVVATDGGDLVLDNLAGEIRPWTQTAYTWEARQSPADPLVWLAVQDNLSKTSRLTVALNEPAPPPPAGAATP